MLVAVLMIGVGSASAQQVVDNFDDVSLWGSGYPQKADGSELYSQGTDPAQVYEGTGSMVIDYTPMIGDGIYLKREGMSLDLSAEAAAGGAVSIMMYVEEAGDHAAITMLKMATAYYHSEFQWDAAWGATYNAGWNELVIPLADFSKSGSSSSDPTWSNITRIDLVTGAYPDPSPTDIIIDNWTVTPEPASMALLGLGGLLLRRRKA